MFVKVIKNGAPSIYSCQNAEKARCFLQDTPRTVLGPPYPALDDKGNPLLDDDGNAIMDQDDIEIIVKAGWHLDIAWYESAVTDDGETVVTVMSRSFHLPTDGDSIYFENDMGDTIDKPLHWPLRPAKQQSSQGGNAQSQHQGQRGQGQASRPIPQHLNSNLAKAQR